MKVWISRLLGLLVGVPAALLLYRSLLTAGVGEHLWGDNFDSKLTYWIFQWGHHILAEKWDWLNFWNANSFYPHAETLAYSESFIGYQLVHIPLRMLGLSPLTAIYSTLALFVVLGCSLTNLALDRIGGFTLSEKALLIFGTHFSLPVVHYMFRMQLVAVHLAPAILLFVFLVWRDLKRTDLFAACSIYVLATLASGYLGPMVVVLCVLVSLPLAAYRARDEGIRRLLELARPSSLAIVVGHATILFLAYRPYLDVARTFPRYTDAEVAAYAADPSSLFYLGSHLSHWYPPSSFAPGQWEYAYFPGYLLLAGMIALLLMNLATLAARALPGLSEVSDRLRRRRLAAWSEHPTLPWFIVITFATALVLSWGPYLKAAPQIRLPFGWLTASGLVPGLSSVRGVGRFGIFLGLPLAGMLVYVTRWLSAGARARRLAPWLLLAVLVVESWTVYPVYAFSPDPSGVYSRVADAIEPKSLLLELPVRAEGHMESLNIILEQLAGSTIHWANLFVGYGADKKTEELAQLQYLDYLVQEGHLELDALLEFAREHDVRQILLHVDRYPPEVQRAWRSLMPEGELRIVFEHQNSVLLRYEPTN